MLVVEAEGGRTMPAYHRVGAVPAKRHVQFRAGGGGDGDAGALLAEEVFGAEGFSGVYSLLYHRHLPPQARSIEYECSVAPLPWTGGVPGTDTDARVHRVHLLRTGRLAAETAGGDGVEGRVPLLFNDEVHVSVAVVDRAPVPGTFYRNGTRDELLFVHEGEGTLATNFGLLRFHQGDYLCIPRGTIQQLRLDGDRGRVLVVEGRNITTPTRYRNEHGQLLEHAPYWERDFRKPEELERPDPEASRPGGGYRVRTKIGDELHGYCLEHHPFDVVGWDGYLYPYAFSIHDFEPHAGRLHVPPTTHQVFQGDGFVVCNFVPRKIDWDPDAVPVPYYHSNIDSDEVIYYAGGSYGARPVQVGDITLHPRGVPHGPSAGAVERALQAPRETDELAVMVDTFRPLTMATACADLDDASYLRSWD
jgi:homogentisate 1,2-dioxygenase